VRRGPCAQKAQLALRHVVFLDAVRIVDTIARGGMPRRHLVAERYRKVIAMPEPYRIRHPIRTRQREQAYIRAFRSAVRILREYGMCVTPHGVCARAGVLLECGYFFQGELSHDGGQRLTLSARVATCPRTRKGAKQRTNELQKVVPCHSCLEWLAEEPLLFLRGGIDVPWSEESPREPLQFMSDAFKATLSQPDLQAIVTMFYVDVLWKRDMSLCME
jgi:hypothetical protein